MHLKWLILKGTIIPKTVLIITRVCSTSFFFVTALFLLVLKEHKEELMCSKSNIKALTLQLNKI